MGIALDLLKNAVLWSAFASWGAAQLLKGVLHGFLHGFSSKAFFTSGGMPSGHAATFTGLAMAVGLMNGFGSASFALALFLDIVVIYDASGVRYVTGLQSAALNRLSSREIAEGKEKPLPEKMGHTPKELVAGIFVGGVIGFLISHFIFGYSG